MKGDPRVPSRPQPKRRGWHWTEWACEFAGTFFQLFFGFVAVAIVEYRDSPIRRAIASSGLRLIVIGLAFGSLAALVAVSPLGRRSGAHLNPAVTAGFWARGHTHPHDLFGYAIAQTAGATAAAVGFVALLGGWADAVHGARTQPGDDVRWWIAAAIEAALTFGLLSVIFLMVSHPRTARLTPAAVVGWLPILIWLGASHTGASMNPARSIGPDIATHAFPALPIYLAAPVAGAVTAALLFGPVTRRSTLTAKLFHDQEYPTTHASALPAKPATPPGRHA